jgi:nucleotide-binding universal stress UspA family protein
MRVLFATDGSETSMVAAELVRNTSWPAGTSVDVIRVVQSSRIEFVAGPWPNVEVPPRPDVDAQIIQDAEDALVTTVESLRARGLRVSHAVLRGRPADAILEWIGRHRPDLVVVGSRGMSPFQRTLLGSVSSELVDASPVPVLVARRPFLDRVVLATDGSEPAAEAVDTVRRWPFLKTAEMRALTVVPAPAPWWPGDLGLGAMEPRAFELDASERAIAEHEGIVAQTAARLRAEGFRATPEVLSGPPAASIVRFATDWGADLVILGSHGRTGLSRLLLGSVARNVLHHATCSVLIVRRHLEPKEGREVVAVTRPLSIASAH